VLFIERRSTRGADVNSDGVFDVRVDVVAGDMVVGKRIAG
jgi:hypothetical protein